MRLFFFPQSHHLLGVCGFSTCRWQCCEEYCCQHIFHQLQTPSCLGCFCWPVMISCGFSAIISSYNLTRFPDAIRGENVRKGPNSSNVYFCCLSAIFTRKKQVRRGGWTQHKYLKPKKLVVKGTLITWQSLFVVSSNWEKSTAEQVWSENSFFLQASTDQNPMQLVRCDMGCSSTWAPHSLDNAKCSQGKCDKNNLIRTERKSGMCCQWTQL